MAQAITRKEIRKTQIVRYEDIRNSLKTGDLIFCSGNYTFSKIIQRFTKSVWSHVGIVYYDTGMDRMLILESEKLYGVRLAPLSKYIKDYHGKNKPYKGVIAVARLEPELDVEVIKKGIGFGMDELTKPYDDWEILRIAFRILFKVGRRVRDRKYICSELVQACYHQAG
ncbi:MAG TPA: YiiX/YebB-like N1pC/P60 family cysteine hydrolase, partial [Cyclobacteriaceae bacterium]|nr:YiiX/YebB-like N1pC/P60 family cysteine hydrolase [Cyclobacteriaceae bacterium]